MMQRRMAEPLPFPDASTRGEWQRGQRGASAGPKALLSVSDFMQNQPW